MHDAGDRGGDEPWKAEHRIDGDHKCGNERIVIVRVSVRDFVGRMVDNVPRDAIVQETQYKGERRGSGRHENDPGLAIEIQQVDKPRPPAVRFDDIRAVVGKVGRARLGAAIERRCEGVRNVQFLRGYAGKDKVLQGREENDGDGDSVVRWNACKGV